MVQRGLVVLPLQADPNLPGCHSLLKVQVYLETLEIRAVPTAPEHQIYRCFQVDQAHHLVPWTRSLRSTPVHHWPLEIHLHLSTLVDLLNLEGLLIPEVRPCPDLLPGRARR